MTIGLDKLGFVLRWEIVPGSNAYWYCNWVWILTVDYRILERLPRLVRFGHIPTGRLFYRFIPRWRTGRWRSTA